MLFQDYKTDSDNRSLCVSACMHVDNARRQDLIVIPLYTSLGQNRKSSVFSTLLFP